MTKVRAQKAIRAVASTFCFHPAMNMPDTKPASAFFFFFALSVGTLCTGGSVGGGVQASELSVPEFLKQASAYDLASKTRIGQLLKNSQSEVCFNSSPRP